MHEYRQISDDDVAEFRSVFLSRLELARALFAEHAFRIPADGGKEHLSVPLYDATMVALDKVFPSRNALLGRKKEVYKALSVMLNDEDAYDVIIGSPNTAAAIKERQRLLKGLFDAYI